MLNRKFIGSGGILGVAVALLAGCGGGGGGGSSGPSPTPQPTTPPVAGQLLFDTFNGSSLNKSLWGVYDSSQILQRTRFGFEPELRSESGVSFARMRLDSYNPQFPGQFKGTEIYSRQRFARGQGLEIESRLRGPNLPPGIVYAFFTIYDRYTGAPTQDNYRKTEIDYEFLTAEQEQFSPAGQRRRLYLNIWDDWTFRDGYDEDNSAATDSANNNKTYRVSVDPNFNAEEWNTFTIRWLPDRTEYLVNGNLERTERVLRPDEDMSVHLNMWTGLPDFSQAYSTSLQPATSSGGNRSNFFDVDYVRVRQLGANAATSFKLEQPLAPGLKSYRNR